VLKKRKRPHIKKSGLCPPFSKKLKKYIILNRYKKKIKQLFIFID